MNQSSNYKHLIDVLDQSLDKYGECELFGTKDPTGDGGWAWLTYRKFGERVSRFRGGLSELGVGAGDTIGIISSNRVEWAVAAYATYGLGARFCPMYESQLEKDWRYILLDSGTRILITSTREIYDVVRAWTGEVGQLEHIVCMDLAASEKASFAALEKCAPVSASSIDPSMVCGFIYTSGTTGKPKGVLLTHENICSNLNGIAGLLPVDQSDVSVSFLPWAHSFGQTCELHSLLSRGAAMAIAESIDKLVDNFAEVRPTVLFSVPRIFNRIYDGLQKKIAAGGGIGKFLFEAAMRNQDKRAELAASGRSAWLADALHRLYDKLVFSKVRQRFGGRLRYAVSGGAALSPDVAHFIDKLGIFVCEGYGLTETSPIVSTNHPKGRKIGSVGRPIPGVEVVIDTSVVNKARRDRIGEIVVYGANVMKGYHGLSEATAEVINEDGGFRTGDLGFLDADGFLFITGRIKEQYKLENGKYVVPAPLEDLIQLSPLISQAFVHGANRLFNIALLVPDTAALVAWAGQQGITSDVEEIIASDAAKGLFEAELERVCSSFKRYERPKAFELLGEEFSIENGMLTPKLSLKRNVVLERYGGVVEALYSH